MINAPQSSDDILERLRHPEREAERRRPDRLFLVRNVLNVVFIIVALVAMVGIAYNMLSGSAVRGGAMVWYAVGLFAVLIKMVEVMLRMPAMTKRGRESRTRSRQFHQQ